MNAQVRWTALAYAALAGLVGGAALDVLTFLTAHAGPVGDGWSFRGDGALVIPLGLGPALLAGGWTADVLRYRGSPQWRRMGVEAGILGALFATASVVVLVAFGSAAQRMSDYLTLPAFAWPFIAVLIAAIVPLPRSAGPRRAPVIHALAGVTLTVALIAGFFTTEIVLPPGSS